MPRCCPVLVIVVGYVRWRPLLSAQSGCWIPPPLSPRRNPGEPIILVLYGPWHLFFALFLEMVISGYRGEPTVVNKVLPSPCKKKERAHGPFKRSWASYDILFCSLARTTVFAKTMSCHGPQATANSQTHACSHFTTTRRHGVLLGS